MPVYNKASPNLFNWLEKILWSPFYYYVRRKRHLMI